MNKVFRILWSEARQAHVVAHEKAASAGKPASTRASAVPAWVLSLVLGFASVLPGAWAQVASNTLPTGASIVAGTGSIATNGSQMRVTQSTDRLITNWQSFNIGASAEVQFVQPSASSIALNRIQGQSPSQIFGKLSANGQLMLVNPSGIVFGAGSQVHASAILASTLQISDASFLAGNYLFANDGTAERMENHGSLGTAAGGVLALMAPVVYNTGRMDSPTGSTLIAAADKVTLDLRGDGVLRYTLDYGSAQALIANSGHISAAGGQVVLTARALDTLTRSAINNTGLIEASSLVAQGGRIVLEGDAITLAGNSQLEAKGATGGGEVLVGGGWQGSGAMRQALAVQMDAGSSVDVSATHQGDGGTAVVWTDVANAGAVTSVQGLVKAEGAAGGGHGGRIETSGHTLVVDGISVSAGAPVGRAGQWLLDPYNITVTGTDRNTSNSAGTFTASADSSAVSAATLAAALASTNVTLSTAGAGTQAGDINVASAITKSSGATSTSLTLLTSRDINLFQNISATSGPLDIILNAGGANRVMANTVLSSNGGAISISGEVKTVKSVLSLTGGGAYASFAYSGSSAGTATGTPIALAQGDLSYAAGNYSLTVAAGVASLDALLIGGGGGGGGGGSSQAGNINAHGGGGGGGGGSEVKSLLDQAVTAGQAYAISVGAGGGGGAGGVNTSGASGSAAAAGGSLTALGASASGGGGGGGGVGSTTGNAAGGTAGLAGAGGGAGGVGGSTANIATLSGTAGGQGPIWAPVVSGAAYTGLGSLVLIYTGTGTITQSSAFTLGGLGLKGTGSYSLTDTANAVGILAAGNDDGSAIGSLGFVNGIDLVIGVVNPTGIKASGPVSVKSQGIVRVQQNIATSDTSSNAVLLVGGKNDVPGDVSGGLGRNVVIENIPSTSTLASITTGAGGRTLIYTGSIANSTNVDGFVGSGSGNFRYYSTESITNYSAALGTSGRYAIYREGPTLTVTANNQSKTYDGLAYSGGQGVTYSGFAFGDTGTVITGSVAYGGSFTSGVNAGTYAITPSGLSTTLGYGVTYAPGTLTISRRPITVTADAKTKTYGDANPALTYTVAADGVGTSRGLISGDSLSGALSTAATNNSNVGDYAIDALALANSNYLLTAVNGTLTISQRPLTVTADAKTRTYGDANPVLTYTVAADGVGTSRGLFTGDSLSGALSTTAINSSAVGSYAIDASALSNGNYLLTAVNGTLTISQRPLTVTADAKTRTYGDANPALTYTVAADGVGTSRGLITGDSLSGVLSTTAINSSAVGSYTIDASALANGNYLLTVVNGTLGISQRPLTVTADAKTKTYGDANPALTYTVAADGVGTSRGLIVGDTLSGTLSTAATSGSGVGSYTIDASALGNSNYLLTAVNGMLTISKRPLTVTADAKTRTYGDANPALTYTVASDGVGTSRGLISGDSLSGALSTAATNSSPVGTQ